MINKFKDIKNIMQDVQNNESFYTLYQIWNFYHSNTENTTGNTNENTTENTNENTTENTNESEEGQHNDMEPKPTNEQEENFNTTIININISENE